MIAEDKKMVNTILEKVTLEKLKIIAKKKGTTVSGLLRMLAIEEIERQEKSN